MKQVSAGVIIINSKNEVLACIPSGKEKMKSNFCDIPKGKIEIGETPLNAAIRETYEESGIDLKNIKLEDLGQHYYLKNKDLHLFKCYLNIELEKLKCTSYFKVNDMEIPEIIDYIWVNEKNIDKIFYKSLYPLILENFK